VLDQDRADLPVTEQPRELRPLIVQPTGNLDHLGGDVYLRAVAQSRKRCRWATSFRPYSAAWSLPETRAFRATPSGDLARASAVGRR
jgi:hypothetical protein